MIISEIRNNFSYLAKRALAATSGLIASFQILGFLCDFNMVFPDNWTFLYRLLASVFIVAALWLVVFGIVSGMIIARKRVTVINAGNGNHVYVEYGDLLEDRSEKSNVVIAANRCFDTIVDDHLIAAKTIHGQAIQKICADGYTAGQLNAALQRRLTANRAIRPETLSRANKNLGNLRRYPAGTIAEFAKNDGDSVTYFFLGMSAFDSMLHSHTTDEEYALTIQHLIQHCNLRSQCIPVYIPVIGTHGRDHQKDERELLEYMVAAFRLHKHLINTDIHIVVHSGRRSEVSIHGL